MRLMDTALTHEALAQAGRCFVCRGPLEPFGPYGAFAFHRCRGCGSLQLYPMPSEAEMVEAYRLEYAEGRQVEDYVDPEWALAALRPYCDAMLAQLRRRDLGAGPVIDCGAGWGGLLRLMLDAGFDARGVELSERQVAYMQARGWPAVQGDLGALRGCDGEAAAVTLLAIFEHLVNHGRVLADARRLLRDDGVLITLHPTASFHRLVGTVLRLGSKRRKLPYLGGTFAAPWHTNLLSIDGTRRLLATHGFEVLEIHPAPQGRMGGLFGLMQRVLQAVNKIGWPLFGTRWPLATSHIFVCRKLPADAAPRA